MSESLKNKTIKGVFWSAIERFSVQGVQFILSFVIARQLLPSDYGLIAMLNIFMALAQCFIDSGFSNALIQKQNRTQADYSTVFYFNLVASILMYILLLLFAPLIAVFYNQPILEIIIIWTGLTLIIRSISTVQYTILAINLNFKLQAIISFIAIIISGSIAIYLATNGYGVWTLVMQGLINSSVITILLWMTTHWRPSIFSIASFKEMFSFGSKLLIGGLMHTAYIHLYTLTIGKIFSPKDLGLYSKAANISQYPSTNITNILDRVIYPVLCKLQDKDEALVDKFYLFIKATAFFVFPMMIGLATISPPFIRLVLTDKWLDIVPFLQILCIAYMWDPIMRQTWNFLNIKHRSDYSLKSEIIKKTVAIGILIITIPFGIKIMCIGLIAYSIADLLIILQFTKRILPDINLKNHIKVLSPIIFRSTIMGIFVYIWINIFTNLYIQLIGGLLIGLISYASISFIFAPKDLYCFYNLLKRK